MSALISDLATVFRLSLKLNGEGRGVSESYLLTATNWVTAVLQGKHIARWRAALSAFDATLVYGVVANLGPNKKSKVVINSPVPCGQGVDYNSTLGFSASDLTMNSPGVGARLRFETADGSHSIRSIRMLPDYKFQEFKLYSTILDTPDLGNFSAAYALEDTSLPYAKRWVYPDVPVPGDAANFVGYNTAFTYYLRTVYQYTQWGVLVPQTESPGASLSNQAWDGIKFRRVSEKIARRPSML